MSELDTTRAESEQKAKDFNARLKEQMEASTLKNKEIMAL